MSKLGTVRRALWHLRHGGVTQLRQFLDRGRATRRTPGIDGELRDRKGNLTFEPWPIPQRHPRRDLRVAVILDEFSRLAFSYEWQQVEITPKSWRTELTERPVDLLFVESAWHGNGDAWQYHLTGASAPRPAFVELVEWCKQQGIPTVFWNKEDPAHYTDFLDSARLFDHVFTTDVNRLEDYVQDLGHDRVAVLPFAAQPAIHNPIRPAKGHQSRDIAFAGMYFAHKYPERRQQMDMLLGAAHDVSPRMDTGLEIFSRYLGSDEKYQFPYPLSERVSGSLDYQRMLTAYRGYKVFLNVNSVVDSPSMCARRIFEISASGTPVVSHPSPAIENFFTPEMVLQVGVEDEARFVLRALVRNQDLRDRIAHLAQRQIWSRHTYGHRVEDVFRAVGATAEIVRRPSVSVIAATNRPHQLSHLLANVGRQVDVDVELVLLTHGFEASETELRARARDAGVHNMELICGDDRLVLGECLNILVAASQGDVVAKVDDDDLYGPHYLSDQLYALAYASADVVGKQAHYVYLADSDITALHLADREHKYTSFVAGPTIVAQRQVALASPFPKLARGEDTGFLEAVVRGGGTVYSADRFNFLQVRQASRGSHTWRASDAEFLASGDAVAFGGPPKLSDAAYRWGNGPFLPSGGPKE